jgi:hypothetical protein
LVLGLLAMASNALAAEIVEVRIGRHANFTRVVFELDRAAGYRIERSDPSSDVAELVVSLDASTIPRRIHSSQSLIEQVEVEPSGSRAIARIRLKKSGLRLKEMILANPARIVLDVFSDKPVPVVAKATPTPAPKMEAVPSMDEPTFEEIVAQLPGASEEPVEAASPSKQEAVQETPREITVVDEPTVSTPLENDDALVKAQALTELQPMEDEHPINGVQPPDSLKPLEMPASTGLAAADGAADTQPTAAATKPKARQPRPMVVPTKPAKDQGSGWMTWALVGGGVVLLLGSGLLVARRMEGGEEVDHSEDDSAEFGNDEGGQTTSDDNPFGEVTIDGRQMTLGKTDMSEDARGAKTAALAEDQEKESESVVFGESEENSMEDMEVISREQVNESLGGMPPVGGGIPEEFQQMMREMNRRVESLEGRIDELVDARDRLERQVAAQTEELRVQRAAIARTQRAVRNLARPEDGEGDQEPTEPAFRDPNQTS